MFSLLNGLELRGEAFFRQHVMAELRLNRKQGGEGNTLHHGLRQADPFHCLQGDTWDKAGFLILNLGQ